MDAMHAKIEPGLEYPQGHQEQRALYYAEKQEMIARNFKKISPLFLITVIIPTLLAILYFGFIASDVYISESRFTVRSPEKSTPTGLGALFKSSGFTNAGDEVYAAQDYVQSRDALQALNRKNAFTRAYSAPSISAFDRFPGIGWGTTFEDLYKYYKKKVDVKYETSSSIVTLTVRAFTPRDAARFNEQLLEMAEATVNKLNERGRQDLIRFAQREVGEAKVKSQTAALALSAYRNAAGVVDPEKQATVQVQMISKLQDELIATRTQLTETRTVSPQNPQIEVLATRAKSLSDEIDKQLGLVAGSSRSLSSRAAQYQRLLLENQFADKQLASAMASLDEARNEANRKQAYVERIVQPNVPDEPLEPRRWRGIFSTFILGLAAWGIISMLVAGMLEHRD
ncbi:WcbD protein [Sphingobium bisphenolivorans]|uniref:WcbD protein n=1 Tax=Sphingobium bisphenolivorans TaxID=1335760 RepID=UPI0003A2C863|nr:WcbD protein [Sphingobium bisphenolivorans]